jgi:tripartite-type tricarboxylate transporter receptor subunit TctC
VPQPILEAINAKVNEISKLPDTTAKLIQTGSVPVISTQAELLAFREAESNSMAELIKVANIKLD